MRILHTSDWHLGRSFHREDLLGHQGVFADHLIDVVTAEAVEVVLVSGDIFDRALPPVDAVELATEIFSRLAAARVRVIAISGNHDSTHRLGANAGLIDAAGVHFRTAPDGCDTPVVIEDRHGQVAFYAIPYLEPETARQRWSLPARSHQAALDHAMGRIRRDSVAHQRSVVLAHVFAAGATPSDSERDISVGGVDRVGVESFAGVSYAALGHLHGSQVLNDAVRYSGSPLAYSFSEASHIKGSWLLDLDDRGLADAEFVTAPVPRRMQRIQASIGELLTSAQFEQAEQAWVEATVTDPIRPADAYERLRRRFPHLMQLRFTATSGASGVTRSEPITGLSPLAVVEEFVGAVRGVECTAAERALLTEVVADCCVEHEAS
ncbi:MAG TPA: exonuclease SbcCD subunit D [Marmoricola sp.]|nr:exonuclease SbcCD subunit D [Marmoricola sp.]